MWRGGAAAHREGGTAMSEDERTRLGGPPGGTSGGPPGGGYGQPPPQQGGYGAPPPAQSGYGPPPAGYGAPPPPQGGYGAPPPAYPPRAGGAAVSVDFNALISSLRLGDILAVGGAVLYFFAKYFPNVKLTVKGVTGSVFSR